MASPPRDPGPRKPAKAPSRTAVFREIARGIVGKDRYDRRAGFSVDTAGAIARALERAYVQGFTDAQAPPSPPAMPRSEDAHAPVEWILIPPRPRDAFWTICLFTLGRDPTAEPDGAGYLYPTLLPSGRPGWQLVAGHGHDEKPFGQATLRPLVRLGLLCPVNAPEPCLIVTARGLATWWEFLARGGQYPEDLTDPPR
jgi:hypothetical protein